MRPRYMLDTNMCIYLMKNQPESVARRFSECYVGEVVMSAITYAELQCGVAACDEPHTVSKHLNDLIEDIPVAPFDAAAAIEYGPLRFATQESTKDHLDKLIAAHALSLNAILVTNNEKDFSRYPKMRVENWLNN